jgi:hypothetical protein
VDHLAEALERLVLHALAGDVEHNVDVDRIRIGPAENRILAKEPAFTTLVMLIDVFDRTVLLNSATSRSTWAWYAVRLSAGSRSTLLS